MSTGKISELVSPEALDQLDQLYKKLGIVKSEMAAATEQGIKFTNAISNTKNISEFIAAQDKASAAMQTAMATQDKVIAQQKEVVIQTQAVTDSVKSRAAADANAGQVLKQVGGSLEANIKLLIQQKLELKNLNEQIKGLSSNYAGSAQSQNALATKTQELTTRQLALKEAISAQNLVVRQQVKENNAAGTSQDAMQARLNLLRKAYSSLSEEERKNAQVGGVLLQNIKQLATDTAKLNAEQGKHGDSVGNYGKVFDFLKSNILNTVGAIALITAAWSALKEAFSHNVEISDNFVDVQRTAKLSADEVDKLGEQLKKINTRTSLEGLLDIGFIGGRLGVAKGDMVSFITTVDQLAVVLKKEFPGGADAVATALGKIIAVYKITQKEGISLEQALKNTGSTFLELAHNGQVTVQYLQDFSLRTAGVAQIAKISLPTMLAYGAVLSQAGITAQVAGSSVTRLISSLSTKRDKYFAIAQLADSTLTIEKFTKLINTDTKSALELFFKGLKAGNPSQTEFGDRLKTLALTTGAAKNAVIALAENQDLLFEKTKLANKANEDGTSITHNFELANNSLAASFEKIGNRISNAFTSSSFARSLAVLLNSLTDNKTEAARLSDEYVNNKHRLDELDASLKPLVTRYDELKGKSKLNTTEQEELRKVTSKIGELLPSVTTKFDDYGNAIDINRGKIKELTKAQRELLELQNRSALKTANNQFDEAYFMNLPKAKEQAVRAAKLKQNSVDSFLDLFQGGDSDAEAKQNARDKITRLSGTAYEAAKAIRTLGGVLTKSQQDVINYYEVLNKPKPGKKQDATIVGDGMESGLGDDGVRTIDDIKADIKRVTELKKPLDVASKEYKDYVKQLIDLRKELKLANGTGGGGRNTANTDALENVKARIAQEKAFAKEILDDDKQTFEARLAALRIYIDRSNKLIDTELKIANSASGISSTKKDTNRVNAATQRSSVKRDGVNETEKIQKEIGDKYAAEQKRIYDAAVALEKAKEDLITNGYNEELLALDYTNSEKVLKLTQAYSDGLVSEKNYNLQLKQLRKASAAEAIDIQITALEKIAEAQVAALALGFGNPKDLQATGNKITGLKIQSNNLKTGALGDGAKGDKLTGQEKTKEILAFADQAVKALDIVGGLIASNAQAKIDALEKEFQLIQQNGEAEKTRVNGSILSSKEKARQNAIIDAQTALQRARITQQENDIKKKQAEFDKAAAIAKIIQQTAIAIVSALTIPIYGIALAAVIGALGAAQLAVAIATPLPKFEHGGTVKKDGPIITGEAGPELRIDPSGKYSLTAGHENVTYAKAGTKIISNKELMSMVAKPESLHYVSSNTSDNKKVEKLLSELVDGQKKQKRPIVNVHADRWGYYSQNRNY